MRIAVHDSCENITGLHDLGGRNFTIRVRIWLMFRFCSWVRVGVRVRTFSKC